MTTPHQPLACPWCAHESTDDDGFRTHLMVEHRKSELARFVLDAQARRANATDQNDATSDATVDDVPSGEAPDDDRERELLAR